MTRRLLVALPLAAGALISGCSSSSSTGTTATPAVSAAAPATSAAAPATSDAASSDAASSAAAATSAAEPMPSMSMTMAPATLSASTMAADAAAGIAVVHIKDYTFSAPSTPVKAGQMFEVVNDDAVAHTYEDVNHAFDSGNIKSGASKMVKAPAAGSYALKCDYHPSMHGTLTVDA